MPGGFQIGSAFIDVTLRTGGALAGLAALQAAAAGAGAALAALPALAGSIASSAGVMTSSFSGVGDALKAYEADQKAVTKTGATAAKTAVSNAKQIRKAEESIADARKAAARTARDSSRQVQDAEKAVQDAAEDTAERVADAKDRQADVSERGAERIAAAGERVQDAQRDELRAQEALTEARKDAADQLEDLRESVEDFALDEEGASIRVAKAQQRLRETNADHQASTEERAEAAYNLKKALDEQADQLRDHKKATEELNDAEKKGVEGSDKVVAAKDKVADAEEALADAQKDQQKAVKDAAKANQDAAKDVAKAVKDGAERQADAESNLSRARESAAEANADAADRVSDAQENLRDVQDQQAASTAAATAATSKYAEALKLLSPIQRDFVKELLAIKPAWEEVQSAGDQRFLTGVISMLEDSRDLFPILKENFRDTGRILGDFAEDMGKLFTTLDFQRDLDDYLDNSQVITKAATDSFVRLTAATVKFGGEMDKSATGFAGFITSVTGGVEGFLTNLAKYDADFQKIWDGLGDIVNAVLPALGDSIGQIAKTVAPVFTSIGDFLQDHKEDLSTWITGLLTLGGALLGLKVAGGIARGLTGLVGTLGSLGGVSFTTAARVGLVAAAVGGLAYAYADAKAKLDAITDALGSGAITTSDAAQRVKELDQAWSSTRWTDTIDDLLNLQSIHFDTIFGDWRPFGEEVDHTKDRLAQVTDEAKKLADQMTPLEKAQQRVTTAQDDYGTAVSKFGDNSPQAIDALGRIRQATKDEEAAQLAAKYATQDHTDALREQQDQMLAMSDANLAQRQAVLDLKSAQKDAADAVRDHGKGSDEDQQAQIRLEQAQNRVITSTQQQTKTANEGSDATWGAQRASDQFTYTNLVLAATMGKQASPSVQQFARDMTQADLDAYNAAQKVSGFHTEVKLLPDGREVYIRTDPETNEVINYREELNKIPPIKIVQVRSDGFYTLADGTTGGGARNSAGGTFQSPGTRYASGGILPGYTPGRDVMTFFAADGTAQLGLSGGEAIMRPEFTRAVGSGFVNGANMAARSGGVSGVKKYMGFKAGGVYDYLPPMAGDQVGDLNKIVADDMAKSIKNFMTPAYTGAMAGAGVQRWASVVLQALAMVGQPASLLQTVLRRMNQESGGNPRAINNWDSNAKRGTPSKGLMQTIDPTFNAYAGELRGRGVWDPLANIYASMRYAMSRYGSLSRAYNKAGGYDSGGYVNPGITTLMNATGKPEAVLDPVQSEAFVKLADSAASGGGAGGVTINIGTLTTPDAATFVKDMKQMARRGRKGGSA